MSSSDSSSESNDSSLELEEEYEKPKNVKEEEEEEEEEYSDVFEVEQIIKHKFVGKKRMFFIKWKGYPHSENTWEKEENLNCPDILKKYLKKVEERDEMIRGDAKPIKIPEDVISVFKINGTVKYKVKYTDGSIGELASSTIRKLNPLCAISFLERSADFPNRETI